MVSRYAADIELVLTKSPVVINHQFQREKYRSQFMNSKDQEIFRYDNAPHHKSVSSFPHHKHIENKVYDSIAPSLTKVLKEAECQILGLPLK